MKDTLCAEAQSVAALTARRKAGGLNRMGHRVGQVRCWDLVTEHSDAKA
jgi:3-methyladenine DNA glycosylase AlkD